jgi:putative ABC transport system permease protein
MLKNYLKFAWRHFYKDGRFTLLNLLGLSTGMACTILIYSWIISERSMDDFHVNNPRLYQVMSHIQLSDGIHTQENTPGPLYTALAADMPEIERTVAVIPIRSWLTIEGEKFNTQAQYVSKDFFKLFSYRLLKGDKDHLFPAETSVLVSDELAKKLFQTTENCIGRTLQWGDDSIPYVVSGVFAKPPVNSTAQFDLLLSCETYLQHDANLQNWFNSSPETYILVKPGTSIDRLNAKLNHFEQTKNPNAPLTLSLRNYAGKYLYNTYENGVQAGGRIAYVRMFSVIAVFILLIACINFMNLSTARAAQRAKELGVKKVSGASRRELIAQYLGESLLLTFAAMILAFGWVALLMPGFNVITGKQLGLPSGTGFILAMIILFVVTGLVAGSYPALYLSGFKPVNVLKGRLPHSPGEVFIRKGLVVFQFTLSVVFIVAVAVIYRQMELVQTMDLGYNKDHVVTFNNIRTPVPGRRPVGSPAFLAELKNIPGVLNAGALDGDMTGHTSGNTEKLTWEGMMPDQKILFYALDVDYDVMDVLGIKMVAGRSFSRNFGNDSASLILNETAVAAMGLKDPIGKTFTVWGTTFHIVGVAKDFHYASLYEKVKPCFIRYHSGGWEMYAKLATGKEAMALAGIKKLYAQYKPGYPFDYNFLDKNYQNLYVSEQRIATLSRYFAGLAVLICCLGLLGLAAFTAQKRQKEIGIRKVVGASVSQVTLLLSGEFVRLVVLSGLIAFPVSWWAMEQWLNGFAYHIAMSPAYFLFAAGMVLLLTLLTTGYQAFKAAVVNPVNTLRAE